VKVLRTIQNKQMHSVGNAWNILVLNLLVDKVIIRL